MKLQYSILLTLAVILLFQKSIRAQNEFTRAELESFLKRAAAATEQYSETFKNLTAEETKTFEDYDKKGRVEAVRKIRSAFIVYQSPKNAEVNEFRNVLEVNGKNVARSDAEMEELFKKLSQEGYVAGEWQKIIRDGVRFDGKSSAWGMTLWQESPLGKLKPFFEFTVAGKEILADRNVIVIEYRQTKPTLLIKFNPTREDWIKEPQGREYHAPVSEAFLPANPKIVGKLWLDAETGQIWRNEFKIIIAPPQLSEPLDAMALVCEYQPSEFGILVPRKFFYTFNRITGSSEINLSVVRDRTMLFEYSKFSKFKSETKDYKIAGTQE